MFSGLVQHAAKLKFLLNENSTTILTSLGVAGTVSTAVLTAKSSFKAANTIETERVRRDASAALDPEKVQEVFPKGPDLTKFEQIKLVWPLYIPPVFSGTVTIASIVLAHKIDAKRIAALTAAAGISERAFQEYKDKIVEKLGERQDQKIRDEVAQDRVTNDPSGPRELIIVNEGKVLCRDGMTGRYFECTNEELKRAQNWVNAELLNHQDCSLSEFYGQIGLEPTALSDSVGWNAANSLELMITTAKTPDNRPCLVVDYHPHPFPTYSRFHGA